MIGVLFVCLGNICRSPMAEGVFKKHLDDKGLNDKVFADSSGTGAYHVGENPDHRMCETAKGYSIILDHKARQFSRLDFKKFDYILVMDEANFKDIKTLADDSADLAKIKLMRDFDPYPESGNVPDPYYGGIDGFTTVYQILDRSTREFLDHLVKKHNL